jgi:uncharacterized membrane protein YhhN
MDDVRILWIVPIAATTAWFHIRAEYSGKRRQVYVFKPLTTSLVVLFALLLSPPVDQTYKMFIVAGLCFSLAGDVFLMLPGDRFVAGLVSFLLAHVAYIGGFVYLGGFQSDWVSLIIYSVYGAAMMSLLWGSLGALRVPVLIYMVVILVMGWQALALWRAYPSTQTLVTAAGAALFVVSDSALAWDRFRWSFHSARALVLSTYYTAQILLALSVAV